jgi:hypothetical protein
MISGRYRFQIFWCALSSYRLDAHIMRPLARGLQIYFP